HAGRVADGPQVAARVGVVDHQVGGAALDQSAEAEPGPAPPGRGGEYLGGRDAGPLGEQDHLLGHVAVVDAAARVGTDVDRYAGLEGGADHVGEPGPQGPHVRGVPREAFLGPVGDPVERLDVDHGGDQRGALRGHPVDQVGGQPGAVFDRVDPGGDQGGDAGLVEGVGGDAYAGGVGGLDRGPYGGGVPGRAQVAGLAVDPVADQLHPAVAGLGLGGHLGGHGRGGDLDADVRQVPAGRGDVP